jgi:hypothetical protein
MLQKLERVPALFFPLLARMGSRHTDIQRDSQRHKRGDAKSGNRAPIVSGRRKLRKLFALKISTISVDNLVGMARQAA